MNELTPEEEYERTVRFIEETKKEIEALEVLLEKAKEENDFGMVWEIEEELADCEFSLAEAKEELLWIGARIGY